MDRPLTRDELATIAYSAAEWVVYYPQQQHDRERYLYQYLNRRQPSVLGRYTSHFRKKIIHVHGYPKVVSLFPSWRQNLIAQTHNTQYPIAWINTPT